MSTQSPLRRLTDEKLRAESSRRRLIATISSCTGSLSTIAAVGLIQRTSEGNSAAILSLAVFFANIGLLLWLFRWMSDPAKERARRRRLSVLKMLGVEDAGKSGAGFGEDAPVDTELPVR